MKDIGDIFILNEKSYFSIGDFYLPTFADKSTHPHAACGVYHM